MKKDSGVLSGYPELNGRTLMNDWVFVECEKAEVGSEILLSVDDKPGVHTYYKHTGKVLMIGTQCSKDFKSKVKVGDTVELDTRNVSLNSTISRPNVNGKLTEQPNPEFAFYTFKDLNAMTREERQQIPLTVLVREYQILLV